MKINTGNRDHGTVGCWALGVYFPLSQILFILISAPKVGSLVLTQMSKFPDNIDVWQYPPTVSFSRPKMAKRRGLVSWFCKSPSPPLSSLLTILLPFHFLSQQFYALGIKILSFFFFPKLWSKTILPQPREIEAQMKHRRVLDNHLHPSSHSLCEMIY